LRAKVKWKSGGKMKIARIAIALVLAALAAFAVGGTAIADAPDMTYDGIDMTYD
jgi:hypothetical protein